MSKLRSVTIVLNEPASGEAIAASHLQAMTSPNRWGTLKTEVARRADVIETAMTETVRTAPPGKSPLVLALESVIDDVAAGRLW